MMHNGREGRSLVFYMEVVILQRMAMLHRAPPGKENQNIKVYPGELKKLLMAEEIIMSATANVHTVILSPVPGGVSIYLISIG